MHVAQPNAARALDIKFFEQPNAEPDQDGGADSDLERTPGGARGHDAKATEDEGGHQHEQGFAACRRADREQFAMGHWWSLNPQVARTSTPAALNVCSCGKYNNKNAAIKMVVS